MTAHKNSENKIRLAVLQRVCTGYRVPLFRRLTASEHMDVTFFFGEDLPKSKVRSSSDLSGISYKRLKTRFVSFGSRLFPLHLGLIDELKRFNPDVILCEGESHFLGYLQAIFYKIFLNPQVALIHWCFISLPGEPDGGQRPRFYIKRFFWKFFDSFLLYSSYSKAILKRLGHSDERLFVATNVGDTARILKTDKDLTLTPAEARAELSLPERFTVLYIGTLDPDKRPEVFLELARCCDRDSFNFVLLGDGPLKDSLTNQAEKEGLLNVFIKGRVTEHLQLYLRSSDVLLIPGRGGIVISEAMAAGVPVIVYRADGTEYDLVKNGETGFITTSDSLHEFRQAIERLQADPENCHRLGVNAKKSITQFFTTDKMAEQIEAAAFCTANRKHITNRLKKR